MADKIAAILENETLVLFLILGLGILVGRIRILGVQLGSVTGVLFFGLIAGHYGFQSNPSSQTVGFLIFIYCVGVQAGPDFLSAFREDGMRYALLALVVAIAGSALAVTFAKVFGLDYGAAAGLLGGALTSTPTLVSAQDVIQQGTKLPEGMTQQQAISNLTSAYAITYVFGMAGLIMTMSFLPKLLRVDVVEEAREFGRKQAGKGGGPVDFSRLRERPTIRAYRVELPDLVGRSEKKRKDETLPAAIQGLKRGDQVIPLEEDTEIEAGDILSVVGLDRAHKWAREHVGPEVVDYDVMDRALESRRVIVTNRKITGNTIGQMDFRKKYGCFLTEIRRAGMPLPYTRNLALIPGDVLLLTGAEAELDHVSEVLGFEEKQLEETDLLSLLLGIGVGVLIGGLAVPLGNIAMGLGTAGGVLLIGVCMGIFHTRRPDLAGLPAGARNVLMELGLLLFMVGVAVNAGTTIIETLQASGVSLALSGVAITLTPVFIGWAVGRYLLKMNSAILLGAITGAMTSTAALKQVQDQAKSEYPMLGYVGAYTFANVLLTIAGAIVVRL